MKKLVKIVSPMILVAVILIMSSLPALAAEYDTIDIYIQYDQNLYFAQYGVDVYLDGELVGTLDHGQDGSGELYVDSGRHTLTFCKSGDTSVYGSQSFYVYGDTDIDCRIISHEFYIELVNFCIDGQNIKTEKNAVGQFQDGAMDIAGSLFDGAIDLGIGLSDFTSNAASSIADDIVSGLFSFLW